MMKVVRPVQKATTVRTTVQLSTRFVLKAGSVMQGRKLHDRRAISVLKATTAQME